jgi:hypothetical protein
MKKLTVPCHSPLYTSPKDPGELEIKEERVRTALEKQGSMIAFQSTFYL